MNKICPILSIGRPQSVFVRIRNFFSIKHSSGVSCQQGRCLFFSMENDILRCNFGRPVIINNYNFEGRKDKSDFNEVKDDINSS